MTGTAILALLRRFWPALLIIALCIALWITRGQLAEAKQTLSNERAAWSAEVDRAQRQRAEDEARWARQGAAAAVTYADRIAAREPIILHSTNTVREYAQTDAGRARCLGADRVRSIDALDVAIFPDATASTGNGDVDVPADAAAASAGR